MNLTDLGPRSLGVVTHSLKIALDGKFSGTCAPALLMPVSREEVDIFYNYLTACESIHTNTYVQLLETNHQLREGSWKY